MLCRLVRPSKHARQGGHKIRGIDNKASQDQRRSGTDASGREQERSTMPNSPQDKSPKRRLVFGGERRCGPLSTDYGGEGMVGRGWSGRGARLLGSRRKSRVHQRRWIDHKSVFQGLCARTESLDAVGNEQTKTKVAASRAAPYLSERSINALATRKRCC